MHEFMLATPHTRYGKGPAAVLKQLHDSGQWSYEFKFDGCRALLIVQGNTVRLINRRGRDITFRYPDIIGSISGYHPDIVLDGEIIVADERGRPDFHQLQRRDAQESARAAAVLARRLPAQFVAFDVLETWGGEDLRREPYHRRRELLEKLVVPNMRLVVPPVSRDGLTMWTVVQDMAMEGLVAKRLDSPYVGRRSTSWVKIKATRRLSALVIGHQPGEGSRAATFGALDLALFDTAGRRLEVGGVGSGFSAADIRKIWALLCAGKEIVVDVEFLELSPDGKLRQPVFRGIRSDLNAQNCSFDQLIEYPPDE